MHLIIKLNSLFQVLFKEVIRFNFFWKAGHTRIFTYYLLDFELFKILLPPHSLDYRMVIPYGNGAYVAA